MTDGLYTIGRLPPNFPVPSLTGEVMYLDDANAFEIIIDDCDIAADPRLYIVISKRTGRLYTDYPHNSPNYR